MNLPWQDLIALALVAIAAGYLGWHGWRFIARRRATGCGGGCSGCAAGEKGASVDGKPLVTIERNPKR